MGALIPFRDVNCSRGTPAPVPRLLAPSPIFDPLRAAIPRIPPKGPEEDGAGISPPEDWAGGVAGGPDGGARPLMGKFTIQFFRTPAQTVELRCGVALNQKKEMALSGLQIDVLKLYRALLRTARKRDPLLVPTVASEFRRRAARVSRTDFASIEHYLRHGYKQKKLMEMPGFSAASVTNMARR